MQLSRAVASAVIAVVFAAPLPLAAQTVTTTSDGQVAVRAHEATVQSVLAEFSRITPLWIRLDPSVAGRPVTADITAATAADALSVVLKASGVDFALTRPAGNDRIRVVVGDSNAPEWTPSPADARAGHSEPAVTAAIVGHDEPRDDEDATAAASMSAPAADVANEPTFDTTQNTAERLGQLLASPPRRVVRPFETVTVAFPSADGQPNTVQNVPAAPGMVRVPFPAADGSPLEIPAPPPTPGWVQVPFPGPDGGPLMMPVAGAPGGAPTTAAVPGGGAATSATPGPAASSPRP